ncbi:MAG TPA: carboxypeptidase-like regulatory domain-containing protein [Terracidiphilus sp.]|nr:carboxypeptidase-like regulatory domain-containing protein [Terracidiphilus sp.]
MSRAGVLAATMMSFLAFGALLAGSRSTFLSSTAAAQNIGMRTVSGTVLDASSAPVAGALVFLKNEKTKTIRSFDSTADGHFHFAQVDMSTDFDLWAEKDSRKSATKTVSSWDARKDFITDLKLK